MLDEQVMTQYSVSYTVALSKRGSFQSSMDRYIPNMFFFCVADLRYTYTHLLVRVHICIFMAINKGMKTFSITLDCL